MKLYLVTCGAGSYYCLATHPTEAVEKVEKYLNGADYGFSDSKAIEIKVLAESTDDSRFITNKYLVL